MSPCCCQLFRSVRWGSKETSLHNSQWWHNSQQYLQIPAKITVFWLVTPCGFVDGNPRLGRLYCAYCSGYSGTPVPIQSTRRHFPVGHMLDEAFRTSNARSVKPVGLITLVVRFGNWKFRKILRTIFAVCFRRSTALLYSSVSSRKPDVDFSRRPWHWFGVWKVYLRKLAVLLRLY